MTDYTKILNRLNANLARQLAAAEQTREHRDAIAKLISQAEKAKP